MHLETPNIIYKSVFNIVLNADLKIKNNFKKSLLVYEIEVSIVHWLSSYF